jgi:arylsulfatase A-like enzyme
MKKASYLKCLSISIIALTYVVQPTLGKDIPNIVFILADDLGITDINAYARHFTDSKNEDLFYEAPHLDKLVAGGIAFSQSYANQLSSPTRAAVLTGQIASRPDFTTATLLPKTR